MINVAVLMGGVYLFWASGLIQGYQGNAAIQYVLMEEKRDEAIVIENVWFESSPSTRITVFVKNIGTRDARIEVIYIQGLSFRTYNVTQMLPYRVYVGARAAFQITYPWSSNVPHLIVVATARGNQARGEWIA